MHCSSCGAQIEVNDRYCSSCGAAIGMPSTRRPAGKRRFRVVLSVTLFGLLIFVAWSQALPRFEERKVVRETERLIKDKKFQLAVEYARGEVSKYPRTAALRFALGIAYLNLDRTGEAQRMFEEAIRLDPSIRHRAAMAAYQVGKARWEAGEWGLPHLQVAGGLAPEFRNDEDFVYLTQVAMASGEPTARIDGVLRFIRRFPNSKRLPDAYLSLATAYESGQRFDDALRAYRIFLQKAPDHPRASSIRELVANWRGYVSRRLGTPLLGTWYAYAGWQRMTLIFRDDGTGIYQYVDTLSAERTYDMSWRVDTPGYVSIQVVGVGEIGGPYELRGRTLLLNHSGQLQGRRLLYERR